MSAKYTPIDADAEASVLAVLLTEPSSFDDIADLLRPEDFGVTAHAEVYRAICACDDAGRPFDQVTVADELRRSKMLDRAGGVEFLEQLVDWAPGAGNVVAHAEIVAEKSKLRRLASAGREIAAAALVPDADAKATLEMAETSVFELGATKAASTLIPMSEAVAGTLSALANRPTGALIGHSTGFSELDRLTSGFQGGQMITVAARPGMGKSAFALQLAAHIAATTGLVVPFLSYEMSVDELTVRLLSSYMRYDSSRLRRGDLVSGMDEELTRAAERARDLPLLIDDQPPETISGVRSAMRRLARRSPLGAVVIDYMQLMGSDRSYRDVNRVQEVSDVSRGLKRLATDLDAPVIALSQLSRNLEGRPNKRPILSDLRESGCVTADTRILLANGAEVEIGHLVATGARDVAVQCIDGDGKMTVGNLTHAFPSGVKKTFLVRTASGHEVKATANHPFRTFDGWVALGDLAIGSHVAVPRNVSGGTTDAPAHDRDELLVLGHLIGDGCVLPNRPIQYTNADPANLDAVEEAARRRFDVTTRRDVSPGHTQLFLSMKNPGGGKRGPIRLWLEGLGLWGLRSYQKYIPASVLALSDEDLAYFLRHLWATDGSLTFKSGTVSCYYATTSRRLADDVKLALARFGIVARLRTIDNGEKGRTGYQVWISSAPALLRFCTTIGVHGARGECIPDAVNHLRSIVTNTNVDVVPVEAWELVRAALRRRRMTLREFHTALGHDYKCGLPRKPVGRSTLVQIGELLEDPAILRAANSDIMWDTIVEIEPIGEQAVYDATVDVHHNFIGNGVILHNSIEQDSSLVLFLYNDHTYHPESSIHDAELILAKQRAGRANVRIPLHWEPTWTTFSDSDRDLDELDLGGGFPPVPAPGRGGGLAF